MSLKISSEIRRRARDAICQLATDDASTESTEPARTRLATLLEEELAEQITDLPPHAAATITAWAPTDGTLDGVNYSLRRYAAAGWHDWVQQDATMPELVRGLARADEDQLGRVIEDAGLVHVAMLADGLSEARRVRLLSSLEPEQSTRATTFFRTPPETAPRREVVKARLNALLSLAGPSGLGGVPRQLGLDAVAHWLASLPAEQREHVRRAWPPVVYNQVSSRRTDTEPQWSLARTTWIGLLESACSKVRATE